MFLLLPLLDLDVFSPALAVFRQITEESLYCRSYQASESLNLHRLEHKIGKFSSIISLLLFSAIDKSPLYQPYPL
jgi:hypothetical protein